MNSNVKLVIYLVYRLRKVMRLSLRKGQRLFNIKYSTYYQIEKFESNLSLLQFFSILDLFSISLSEFQKLLDFLEPFKDKLNTANNVNDADDIVGFKAIAEVDTIILNLIKDTEIYKLNRRSK